ncbi:hypothetical protein K6973_09650 [Streptococcus dysgalactiae]|uniref:hypothetical protein n=1 Tax=Streptococcus dysgalactiae TaxID=1334 RepID=UPI001C9DFF71|nr:hypothetical protein [Streptococcus dysgalactiae]QZT26962.1 hypothetical protein K6973_09650 [Streptococcus dysgalactiae]
MTNTTLVAKYVKLGLVSAPAISAQGLTDQEIYERAQKLDLPEHINGSLKGILNQKLSVTYPKDKAGITQPVAYQAAQPLTDQEIYERAQKLDLPEHINGSLKDILNQNLSVTYPKVNAGVTQPVAYQAAQPLTDQEIYERAQKLDLPDYIGGSLKGILNQNSDVTYLTDKAGATQSETSQATQRLTDQEIYKRAQKLDLPDYIGGSLKGILNQNSSVTYPKG